MTRNSQPSRRKVQFICSIQSGLQHLLRPIYSTNELLHYDGWVVSLVKWFKLLISLNVVVQPRSKGSKDVVLPSLPVSIFSS